MGCAGSKAAHTSPPSRHPAACAPQSRAAANGPSEGSTGRSRQTKPDLDRMANEVLHNNRRASDDDSDSSDSDYSEQSYPDDDSNSEASSNEAEKARLRELQELVVSAYPGQLQHKRAVAGVKKTFKLRVGVLEGTTFLNQYIVVDTLGRGSFGKVKLCLNVNNDRLFAVKVINKKLLKQQGRSRLRSRQAEPVADPLEDLRREVEVMRALRHPNLIGLEEVIDDREGGKVLLVMEYAEAGALVQPGQITPERHMPEPMAQYYFKQIAAGLAYLHENRVVHGDMKPDNVLLAGDGTLKIADFGQSQFFDRKDTFNRTMGTPAYLAPEICAGENYQGRRADVWALGVSLYLFVFGELPFKGESVLDLYEEIASSEVVYPRDINISDELQDLFLRILHRDPERRLTAAEVLQHPWVSGNSWMSLLPDMSRALDHRDYQQVLAQLAPEAVAAGAGMDVADVAELVFPEMREGKKSEGKEVNLLDALAAATAPQHSNRPRQRLHPLSRDSMLEPAPSGTESSVGEEEQAAGQAEGDAAEAAAAADEAGPSSSGGSRNGQAHAFRSSPSGKRIADAFHELVEQLQQPAGDRSSRPKMEPIAEESEEMLGAASLGSSPFKAAAAAAAAAGGVEEAQAQAQRSLPPSPFDSMPPSPFDLGPSALTARASSLPMPSPFESSGTGPFASTSVTASAPTNHTSFALSSTSVPTGGQPHSGAEGGGVANGSSPGSQVPIEEMTLAPGTVLNDTFLRPGAREMDMCFFVQSGEIELRYQADIALPLSSVFSAVINLTSKPPADTYIGYADTADSAVGGSHVYYLGPDGARGGSEEEGADEMERSNTLALTVDMATSRAEALLKNAAKGGSIDNLMVSARGPNSFVGALHMLHSGTSKRWKVSAAMRTEVKGLRMTREGLELFLQQNPLAQVGLRASMATGRSDLLKLDALERIATARKSLASASAKADSRSSSSNSRSKSFKAAAADVLTEAAGTVASLQDGGASTVELFGLIHKLRDEPAA